MTTAEQCAHLRAALLRRDGTTEDVRERARKLCDGLREAAKQGAEVDRVWCGWEIRWTKHAVPESLARKLKETGWQRVTNHKWRVYTGA